MSQKVFAYGSNMCSGRLREYGIVPEEKGEAVVLHGYRLTFDKLSRDRSGKGNVRADEGAEVWGVLYMIPDVQLQRLDDGERGYARVALDVPKADNERETAWVYYATAPNAGGLRPYS